MLKILNLEAGYGPLRVLKGISLHVSPGEAVAIIGANGAGKTTLLKTIAGVLKPRSGAITFNKQDISNKPVEKIVEAGCCLVPEGRHVFSTMTVRENLEMGAYLCRDTKRIQDSMEKVLALFPMLKEKLGGKARELSGGQQQMLAIARGLMAIPELLMFDEPSLGLSPLLRQQLAEKIKEVSREGITIILVEQNARLGLMLASYGYVMENGQLVLQGKTSDLMQDEGVRKAYLGV